MTHLDRCDHDAARSETDPPIAVSWRCCRQSWPKRGPGMIGAIIAGKGGLRSGDCRASRRRGLADATAPEP
jgi:hypothetical protein